MAKAAKDSVSHVRDFGFAEDRAVEAAIIAAMTPMPGA